MMSNDMLDWLYQRALMRRKASLSVCLRIKLTSALSKNDIMQPQVFFPGGQWPSRLAFVLHRHLLWIIATDVVLDKHAWADHIVWESVVWIGIVSPGIRFCTCNLKPSLSWEAWLLYIKRCLHTPNPAHPFRNQTLTSSHQSSNSLASG